MAKRFTPSTADSLVTWPTASGPRCISARSIASTRSRASRESEKPEGATIPHMPHISVVLWGRQLRADVVRGEGLHFRMSRDGDCLKFLLVDPTRDEVDGSFPRGQPATKVGQPHDLFECLRIT